MSAEAVYMKAARKKRLEKELKELERIQGTMQVLSAAGSEADRKNLAFVEAGIARAKKEKFEIESWLRSWDEGKATRLCAPRAGTEVARE